MCCHAGIADEYKEKNRVLDSCSLTISIVSETFYPPRLVGLDTLQQRAYIVALAEFVERFSSAFPVSEIVQNNDAAYRDTVVKCFKAKRNAVIPIAIEMK